MSERITTCPSCGSDDVKTVRLHDPDTHDLNCRADLECRKCGRAWEGRVTSPWTESEMKRGSIL